MNWLFFVILACCLYSVTNFIDKFLIEKRIQNVVAIVVLGGFLYLVLGILIFFFSGMQILPLLQTILLLLAGCLLTFYLIPYFKALTLEDTSRVVPLFQFYPIITLILAFLLLHERLTGFELIGFVLVVVGGFILGTEKISGKIFSLRKSLFLMLASSTIYALSNIIFKFVTVTNFWTNFSYLTFGTAIGCFLLLLRKEYRHGFVVQVRKLKASSLIILGIDDLINLVAELLAFYAISIGPVALVSAAGGVQPFIVLIYGLILTSFFPHLIKEDIAKKTLLTKGIAALILFIGIWFINK